MILNSGLLSWATLYSSGNRESLATDI